MQKNGTIQLETERLRLRKINLNDAEEIFKNWTNDDDVSRYTTWSTHKTVQDTIEWLKIVEKTYQDNINYEWGIELKETKELIGCISAYIKPEFDNRYEIGYVISKKYWRNGYTTESLTAVMEYLINQEKITEFIARHAKLNPASGAVMQKGGFRYIKDGTFQKFNEPKEYETREYYYDVYKNVKRPIIEDAKEIAILVKDGWNTAYKGLIDDSFLKSINIEESTQKWKVWLEDNKDIFIYKENDKILGVIKYGKSENNEQNGEIYILNFFSLGILVNILLSKACIPSIIKISLSSSCIVFLYSFSPIIKLYVGIFTSCPFNKSAICLSNNFKSSDSKHSKS